MREVIGNAHASLIVGACAALLACGCARRPDRDREADPAANADVEPVPGGQGAEMHALSVGNQVARLADPCGVAEASGPLAWLSDDYDTALACARATRRPLVIDLWAPWCHTCLSMKHTVLVDPAMAALADRFVWLQLDTDKPANAAPVKRFPPQAWPTFYVIAPDQSVQARHSGAASVEQFRAFLLQGEQGSLDITADALPADSPLRLVRDGDRAMVAGDAAAAVSAYTRVLEAVPASWPRRPGVLVSLISAHDKAGDPPGCLALARAELANTGSSASVADFVYLADRCIKKLAGPADGRVHAFRTAAADRLQAVIDDPDAPLSADDRSDAMRILRELRLALGDEDGAMQIATRQRAFLDRAASEAPTAFAAMTFHWPRAEVYVYLGVGRELIPALEESIAALPTEYDPPYRLAWLYLNLQEHDRALALGRQALDLAYGPRKASVQRLIANIHKARKDVAAERAARRAVIAIYESLPEGQVSASALQRARDELAAMGGNK